MKEIISILLDGILIRIDMASKKLDFNYPYNPEGMVRYIVKKGAKGRKDSTRYVHWGAQDDECLAKANKWLLNEIVILEEKLAGAKNRLLTKENTTKAHGVKK